MKLSLLLCFTYHLLLSFSICLAHEPSTSKGNLEGEKALAIEQIVSEAVKRVLKENGQLLESFDASKIMELVGQQKLVEKVVEHLAPVPSPKKPEGNSNPRSKSHKTYNIPVGIPAYTPTPISVLKKNMTPSKVENYEPTKSSTVHNVATYKPSSKVIQKCEESYTPSTVENRSVKLDNYEPTNSSSNLIATYNPSSKVAQSSEESYTPSTLENTPDVNYTPSSRESNNITSDRYTPPSNLNCDVDYQPTNRELSSVEPSYSPSCSTESGIVDYSPSSISTLTSEPSYSPSPANSVATDIAYTPSSLTSGQQLSPEKYLELFEAGDEEEVNDAHKKHKSDKDKEDKRKRDKEREKDRERRRRKEKEKEKEREKEKRRHGSSRSSDSDSKSKRSSKHSSSSSSKKSKSSSSKSSESKSESKSRESKSSKNEVEMESDSDVDEECYRIFKVKYISSFSKIKKNTIFPLISRSINLLP